MFSPNITTPHWSVLEDTARRLEIIAIWIYNYGFNTNKITTNVRRSVINLAFPFLVISEVAFDEIFSYISITLSKCEEVEIELIKPEDDSKYTKLEAIICVNATNLDKLNNYTYSNRNEKYTINSTHLYRTVYSLII